MFRLDENRVIDATLAGGLARYINHSCNPNCVAEAVEIDRERKILIIANRKILKGEEVSYPILVSRNETMIALYISFANIFSFIIYYYSVL